MFGISYDPKEGLTYVTGLAGRQQVVLSGDHLIALLRYRSATQKTGYEMSDIVHIYSGDFTGKRGAIQWYLERVNGNDVIARSAGEPVSAGQVFSPQELQACIAEALKVPVPV